MMALAVLVFNIIQCSPLPEPEIEKPPVPVDQLDDKGMRYLMQERRKALDELWRRHLLPNANGKALKRLKARPLGRLHNDDA